MEWKILVSGCLMEGSKCAILCGWEEFEQTAWTICLLYMCLLYTVRLSRFEVIIIMYNQWVLFGSTPGFITHLFQKTSFWAQDKSVWNYDHKYHSFQLKKQLFPPLNVCCKSENDYTRSLQCTLCFNVECSGRSVKEFLPIGSLP